jgi:hypothetical protein
MRLAFRSCSVIILLAVALTLAPKAPAQEEPIQIRLSGLWTGTAPDNTQIAYVFGPKGSVVWHVNEVNFQRFFPLGLKCKYLIRPGKPYWEMDLFEFGDPRFNESRFRAIVEIVDTRTFKTYGKPSSQGERPKDFTKDAVTFHCVTAADHPRYIKQMARTLPEKEAFWAMRILHEAGMAAFPTLIAHFNDPTPAHTGRQITGVATIGQECFEILQYQIEGSWPKAHRTFQILTPKNAKQWLDAHRGQSLDQLRMISRQESLRRAQAELAKNPTDEFCQEMAKFFREEIEILKTGSASRD